MVFPGRTWHLVGRLFNLVSNYANEKTEYICSQIEPEKMVILMYNLARL